MEPKGIQAKISAYIERHPELRLATQEIVLFEMQKAGVISAAEVEEAKKGSLFGGNFVAGTSWDDFRLTSEDDKYKIPSDKSVKKWPEGVGLARDVASSIKGAGYNQTAFDRTVKKVNKDNVVDLVNYFKSNNKKPLAQTLMAEWLMGNKELITEGAIKKVYQALLAKAKEVGADTKQVEAEYNKIFKIFEQGFRDNETGIFFRDTYSTKLGSLKGANVGESLDILFNTLVGIIESREKLTSKEIRDIGKTGFETQKAEIIAGLEGEITRAQESLDYQLDNQGASGWIADFVSHTWASDNTLSKVRKDFGITRSQLEELKNTKTEEEFRSKFKEIFEIEYDPYAIASYKKAREQYQAAYQAYMAENMLISQFSALISKENLEARVVHVPTNRSIGESAHDEVIATKEQVYEEQELKFGLYLAEVNGVNIEEKLKEAGLENVVAKDKQAFYKKLAKEFLDKEFENAGLKEGSFETKYKYMREVVLSRLSVSHLETLFACGLKEFSEVQADYDKAYKSAFGLKNDIVKRVDEYNMSQQKGAQYVKMVSIAAVGLATGGLGVTGVGTAALVGGATSAILESTDQITNVIRQATVSNKDLEDALKSLDLETVAKSALTTSVAMGTFAAAGKGLQFVINKVIPIPANATPAEVFSTMRAQSFAMSAANLVMIEGAEYILTGEITWEGAVFAITVTAAGQILSLHRISVKENEINNPAKTELTDLKSKLGLSKIKDSDITSEFISKLRKAASVEFHPDKYPEGQVPEFDTKVISFETSNGKSYTIKLVNTNMAQINNALNSIKPYITQNGLSYTTSNSEAEKVPAKRIVSAEETPKPVEDISPNHIEEIQEIQIKPETAYEELVPLKDVNGNTIFTQVQVDQLIEDGYIKSSGDIEFIKDLALQKVPSYNGYASRFQSYQIEYLLDLRAKDQESFDMIINAHETQDGNGNYYAGNLHILEKLMDLRDSDKESFDVLFNMFETEDSGKTVHKYTSHWIDEAIKLRSKNPKIYDMLLKFTENADGSGEERFDKRDIEILMETYEETPEMFERFLTDTYTDLSTGQQKYRNRTYDIKNLCSCYKRSPELAERLYSMSEVGENGTVVYICNAHNIYKICDMYNENSELIERIIADKKITKYGKQVMRWSMEEIPTLVRMSKENPELFERFYNEKITFGNGYSIYRYNGTYDINRLISLYEDDPESFDLIYNTKTTRYNLVVPLADSVYDINELMELRAKNKEVFDRILSEHKWGDQYDLIRFLEAQNKMAALGNTEVFECLYNSNVKSFYIEEMVKLIDSNPERAERAIYLVKHGVEEYNVVQALKLDDEQYSRYIKLMRRGINLGPMQNDVLADAALFEYALAQFAKTSKIEGFFDDAGYIEKIRKNSQGKYQKSMLEMFDPDRISFSLRAQVENAGLTEQEFLESLRKLSKSTFKLAMETPHQYLSDIDIQYTTPVNGKMPEIPGDKLAEFQSMMLKFFNEHFGEMARMAKYVDSDTINHLMDRRTGLFEESLLKFSRLTDENAQILSDLLKCKSQKSGKILSPREKMDLILIVEIFQSAQIDTALLTQAVNDGAVNVQYLKDLIYLEILKSAGVSLSDEKAVTAVNKLNQDFGYLVLGNEDIINLPEVIQMKSTMRIQIFQLRFDASAREDAIESTRGLLEDPQIKGFISESDIEKMNKYIYMVEHFDEYTDEEIFEGWMDTIKAALGHVMKSEDVYTIIREAAIGDFKTYINNPDNKYGQANARTKAAFEEAGLNYDRWLNPEIPEVEYQLKGRKMTVRLWGRYPQEDLFMGNKTTCCTAIRTGGNGAATPIYLTNTSYNVVELFDESGRMIGMSRVFMAMVKDKPSIIMDNIELNKTYVKGMSDEEKILIRDNFFKYMNQYAEAVTGTKDSQVYFYSGDIHVPSNDLENVQKTISFIGSLSEERVYVNSVHCSWVDPTKIEEKGDISWLVVPRDKK